MRMPPSLLWPQDGHCMVKFTARSSANCSRRLFLHFGHVMRHHSPWEQISQHFNLLAGMLPYGNPTYVYALVRAGLASDDEFSRGASVGHGLKLLEIARKWLEIA